MDLEVICSHISWSVLNLWEKVIFHAGLLPAPQEVGNLPHVQPLIGLYSSGCVCVHRRQLVLN